MDQDLIAALAREQEKRKKEIVQPTLADLDEPEELEEAYADWEY